ncbi:hypothetical protein GS597_03580 [Synechococcales cyanobacterium C]|uniref:Uncharacterized protein n=1 Tax=Petrachloros mirabilis ULC683 TaxID=2781853 RepID=A0A8K1ZXR5_9CYAN|nr:KGK domain-containing protein [Petrachloros mirabilis]NCJ05602.1 hypothetical protein [Petrachloros mirabilis ULC683]
MTKLFSVTLSHLPMSNSFKPLEDSNTAISLPHNMFKQQEFLKFVITAFQWDGLNLLGKTLWDKGRGKIPIEKSEDSRMAWFDDGIDCEILRPHSGFWQKGKLRLKVTLEFCPEDPGQASDLDPLRQPEA